MNKLKIIKIKKEVGIFAEDKDIAKNIRENVLKPRFNMGLVTHLDFKGVEDMTQSFAHALLSELIRETNGLILDYVYFKNCTETIRKIINIVVDYMQD